MHMKNVDNAIAVVKSALDSKIDWYAVVCRTWAVVRAAAFVMTVLAVA